MWVPFSPPFRLEEGSHLYLLPSVVPATVPERNAGSAGGGTHSQNSHRTAIAKISQGSNTQSFPPSSRLRGQYHEGPREHSSSTPAVYPGSGTHLFSSSPTTKTFNPISWSHSLVSIQIPKPAYFNAVPSPQQQLCSLFLNSASTLLAMFPCWEEKNKGGIGRD